MIYASVLFTVGDRIGPYDIIAPLKSGGMGTTFVGRRVGVAGFAREVAIKVIHPHLAGDDCLVRAFVNEALLSARISHPNVVRVEELGEQDGTHFIVMEYVEGCSLGQLMKELIRRSRALSTTTAVAIAVRVAEGLHAAHETRDDDGKLLNLVHRDISPQNILVSTDGHLKLIDFGIAKARSVEHQTQSGSLKGKIGYMSPEQANGLQLDRRTDVYSLAIVLWELLANRRLFKTSGVSELALIDQMRRPEIEPPSKHGSNISPELDRAVMQALAVDREERPSTANDLRQMLLAASPTARSVDAAHFSGLLAGLMQEQIDEQRRIAKVGAKMSRPRADVKEAVATLTVSAISSGFPLAQPRPPIALVAGIAMVIATIGVFIMGWWWQESSTPIVAKPIVDPPPRQIAVEPPPAEPVPAPVKARATKKTKAIKPKKKGGELPFEETPDF